VVQSVVLLDVYVVTTLHMLVRKVSSDIPVFSTQKYSVRLENV
jgi:hypothetical protein